MIRVMVLKIARIIEMIPALKGSFSTQWIITP